MKALLPKISYLLSTIVHFSYLADTAFRKSSISITRLILLLCVYYIHVFLQQLKKKEWQNSMLNREWICISYPVHSQEYCKPFLYSFPILDSSCTVVRYLVYKLKDISYTWCEISDMLYKVSYILNKISYMIYRISDTLYEISIILNKYEKGCHTGGVGH